MRRHVGAGRAPLILRKNRKLVRGLGRVRGGIWMRSRMTLILMQSPSRPVAQANGRTRAALKTPNEPTLKLLGITGGISRKAVDHCHL
jgi:hypothetical protein